MATEENLLQAKESLSRIQNFDVISLGREDDLGRQMSFVEAISHAKNIIDLYLRIPISILDDFNDEHLNMIKGQSQSDFNLFQQIIDFDVTASNSAASRLSLINSVKVRRDQLFSALWQYIAYGVAKNSDTSLFESQARASLQEVSDVTGKLLEQINQSKADADKALMAIRAVAAEQGVSQQSIYFKEESDEQERLASDWLKYTYWSAAIVIGFAIFSLFFHKMEWIKPVGIAEAVQLVTSKVLIFAVLGYMLIMAARNYITHKHNAVVNKHRQNALLTYRAIAQAAEAGGTEDIILAHAASCIFSPQETGFSSKSTDIQSGGTKAVLELMTKGSSKSQE